MDAILTAVLALIVVIVGLCIVFTVWIAFTERGRHTDDWFRMRWGGSDARYSKDHDDE